MRPTPAEATASGAIQAMWPTANSAAPSANTIGSSAHCQRAYRPGSGSSISTIRSTSTTNAIVATIRKTSRPVSGCDPSSATAGRSRKITSSTRMTSRRYRSSPVTPVSRSSPTDGSGSGPGSLRLVNRMSTIMPGSTSGGGALLAPAPDRDQGEGHRPGGEGQHVRHAERAARHRVPAELNQVIARQGLADVLHNMRQVAVRDEDPAEERQHQHGEHLRHLGRLAVEDQADDQPQHAERDHPEQQHGGEHGHPAGREVDMAVPEPEQEQQHKPGDDQQQPLCQLGGEPPWRGDRRHPELAHPAVLPLLGQLRAGGEHGRAHARPHRHGDHEDRGDRQALRDPGLLGIDEVQQHREPGDEDDEPHVAQAAHDFEPQERGHGQLTLSLVSPWTAEAAPPLSADVRAISASSRPPPPTSMALICRPSAYSAGSVASASVVRTVTAFPLTSTSLTPGSPSSSDGSGVCVVNRSVLMAVNALMSAGVPSAMTRPWFTTMIRLALASASSR